MQVAQDRSGTSSSMTLAQHCASANQHKLLCTPGNLTSCLPCILFPRDTDMDICDPKEKMVLVQGMHDRMGKADLRSKVLAFDPGGYTDIFFHHHCISKFPDLLWRNQRQREL